MTEQIINRFKKTMEEDVQMKSKVENKNAL